MTKVINRVLIVAHDAGGAEILAHYVQQQLLLENCLFVIDGPAKKVFKRVLGELSCCSLQQGLAQADWCLCGTSWQSDLEWQALKQAKLLGKRVVSFIDHWINYQQRFIRSGELMLPDELWVGDYYAKEIAQKTFPDIPIYLVDNPYLKSIAREIKQLKTGFVQDEDAKTTLLFVSENISGHARLKYGDEHYFGYTEFEAIEFLLSNLDSLDSQIKTVLIRPHPSDYPDKYADILKRYPDKLRMSQGETLLSDIQGANWVAGCESMALVVALLAGKTVISCIPAAVPCHLPHQEIISLRDIVK